MSLGSAIVVPGLVPSYGSAESWPRPGSAPAGPPPLHNELILKDDKYWERRRKNNLAAKKSRDSRRIRENQMRLRVLCLENANQMMKEELERKDAEIARLK